LVLAADFGGAFGLSDIKPNAYRTAATKRAGGAYGYQCFNGGFALWAGQCEVGSVYLTAYVLHVLKVADRHRLPADPDAVRRALNYLELHTKSAPPSSIQWQHVWGASQAYAVKVLAEQGRRPGAAIARLVGMAEQLPIFALSYLADALAASGDRGPRYQDVVRRISNALRIEADRAHVEEIDEHAIGWLWTTNARSTAVVLRASRVGKTMRRSWHRSFAGCLRLERRADGARRTRTRRRSKRSSRHYRAFESETPALTASVKVGATAVGSAKFSVRSTTAQQVRVSIPVLMKHVAAGSSPTLSISRAGTGRVYYTARVQYLTPQPAQAEDRGFHVERRYEKHVVGGKSPATTTFNAGDPFASPLR
jgi:hypothetical protein